MDPSIVSRCTNTLQGREIGLCVTGREAERRGNREGEGRGEGVSRGPRSGERAVEGAERVPDVHRGDEGEDQGAGREGSVAEYVPSGREGARNGGDVGPMATQRRAD